MAESLVKGFAYQGDIIADLRQEIEQCQARGHHAFLPGLKKMLRTELKALGISSESSPPVQSEQEERKPLCKSLT